MEQRRDLDPEHQETDAQSSQERQAADLLKETLAAFPELASEALEISAAMQSAPLAATQTLSFLKKQSAAPPTQTPKKIEVGTQVGPYRLLKQLGEGGMGMVFLAEQKEPVTRQVALKFLRLDGSASSGPDVLASEMQALALMNHSHIAKVYDTGFTESGMPYFAMELVTGQPITDYCDAHRLTIRQRLRLFIRVCSGITHAHQRGIIHRDIKPDNILIMTEEGQATPKIIDFGVAKATHAGNAALLGQQDDDAVVGTPAYISPEQINNPQQVDTRTDVYALGILLYELLVGALPYIMKSPSVVALLVKVLQGKHPDLATRFDSLEATRKAISDRRRTTPKRLVSLFKGDLNSIVKKSIRVGKEDRYDSVAHLAADLDRWLRRLTVEAHPATAAYRMSKFLRRHWLATLTIAVSTTSLIAGLALAVTGYLQAVRSKEAVIEEAQKSKAINAFLTEMLASADPETQGGAVQVVDILDNAAREIHAKIGDQPDVEGHLRETLGNTYNQLGRFEEALRETDEALSLYRETLGEKHPVTLNARRQRARILKNLGETEEAERILAEVVVAQSNAAEIDEEELIQTQVQLAIVKAQLGKTDRAKVILASLESQLSRTREPSDPTYLTVRNNLAQIIERQGELDEAAAIYQEIVDIRRATLGEDHPATLSAMNNLAHVFTKKRQFDKAEEMHRETLERRTSVLGPKHPATLISMSNLATVFLYRREFSKAEELLRRVLELRTETLGAEHPKSLDTRATLVTALWGQGKLAEAEQICREQIEIESKLYGPTHPNTLRSRTNLGFILANQNRLADALVVHQAVLRDAQTQDTVASWQMSQFKGFVGMTLGQMGRYSEAEPLLLDQFETYTAQFGPNHPNTRKAVQSLVTLYTHWKRTDRAKVYQDMLKPADPAEK